MQCSRSKHEIFVWIWILIRICRFMPLMDPDADLYPAIFVIDCQDANKTILKKSFTAYNFLKVHLYHFSKIKVQKKSENSRNQGFSYYFCLMTEGSRSKPLTSGSGSGRPKIMWIRFQIQNTGTMYDVRTDGRTFVQISYQLSRNYIKHLTSNHNISTWSYY
jgi:hypothetical protein